MRKKEKRRFLVLLLFLTTFLGGHFETIAQTKAAAQQINEIKGRVVDANSTPLAGVVVKIQGANIAVATNANGYFTLPAKSAQTLLFSSIGYKPIEEKLSPGNNRNIVMQEDNIAVDEVVVVGYGTQSKETLTGAISKIGNSDITSTKSGNLIQDIQGKVAGLQIRQGDGAPGSFNNEVSIRGFGAPVYVIDGIVRDGGMEFQKLNPDDIESISVLKDASAAIFGMDADNGAIIITTKKAKEGRVKVSYNTRIGYSKPTSLVDMADSYQWYQLYVESEANLNGPGTVSLISKENLEKLKNGQSVPGIANTDWYDLVFRKTAPATQYHSVSLQGGGKSVTNYLNFSFNSNESLLKTNALNYKQYSFRDNLTYSIRPGLNLYVNLSGRYDITNSPGRTGTNIYEILKNVYSARPGDFAYANNNEDYLATPTILENPLALISPDIVGKSKYSTWSLQTSAELKYKLPIKPSIELRARISYDPTFGLSENLTKDYSTYAYDEVNDTYIPSIKERYANVTNNNSMFDRFNWLVGADYKVKFLQEHSVAATLMFEQKKNRYVNSAAGRKFDFYINDIIDNGDLNIPNSATAAGNNAEEAWQSLIGRVNYDYKKKYMAEFLFRYEGSFRYSPSARWAFFPGVSVGWRLSEEKFIAKNLSWVSNLKLRASWGISGHNWSGGTFDYIPGYTYPGSNGGGYIFGGQWTQAADAPRVTNENLSWVRSETMNAGIDIGLWANKLDFSLDVYRRTRTGMPATRTSTLPNTSGLTFPQENLNSDRTEGIEMSLGYRGKAGSKFSYGARGTFNMSRTCNLHKEGWVGKSSYDIWRDLYAPNRYQNIKYVFNVIGQFQNFEQIANAPIHGAGNAGNSELLPGDYILEDVDGNGRIDGNDRIVVNGGSMPSIHYGLNLDARWGNLDINILFQGAAGFTKYLKGPTMEHFLFTGNINSIYMDRWHLADPYDANCKEWIPGKYPPMRDFAKTPDFMKQPTTVNTRNASYLRLKSIEIGYVLPKRWLKKINIEYVRVFANGYNLFTICDPIVKQFDPEKLEGIGGSMTHSENFTYPITKTFNVGLNLTF